MLTNSHARYTFTSRGGGLKFVELLDYPEIISARWTKTKTAGDTVASLNRSAPVPVLALLGDTNLVGDGVFTLAKTDDGVRAEKLLPDGLRLVKEFHIGSNYLVNASVRLENTTARPLAVPAQEWVAGTAAPMDVDDNNFGYYGGSMWYNGANSALVNLSYFSPGTTTFFFFPRTPKFEYREGASNVVWAAVENQFFTLLAMPKQPAGQIGARPVTLQPFPRAGAGLAAAAGRPDDAGLSGTNAAGEFQCRAADRSLRRAEGIPEAGGHRRGISKSRRSGDEFRHGFLELLGHRNLLCENPAAGDERGA